MRVLYFSRDYTSHDHRFLAALAQTEHQVYFLRLERRGHSLESRSLPPQIEQVHWVGGQSPARLADGPGLWAGLRRVLRQIKPDLVHAGPIQRSAPLAALAGARPLVSMSWGYDLIADAERGPAWRWATRYTLRRSAVLIGDSLVVRQLARGYGMPDERIVTFPWGVDLGHFRPADPTPGPSPLRSEGGDEVFTLLCTRTWEPIYGVETVARAFVRAARQHAGLRLVMLGGGSQAGLLRQIFAQGGVEERVFFPGQVSYQDLPRYYRSADLYLSASYSDGASISLLEALACGAPALVSDIPGNQEWVEDAWRFPQGDAAALAERILYAAAQPEELAGRRLAARALAEQRADWGKNVQGLLQAYQLAVNSR